MKGWTVLDWVASVGLFVALGVASNAQSAERHVRIGMLCAVTCETPIIDAFRAALAPLGWVEGRNLVIEYRGAGGHMERLPALAREIVATRPDLLVAFSPQPSRAAKDAAGPLPLVFVFVADPVGVGLVQSLARPGANVTGLATVAPGGLVGKSFELAKDLMPGAKRLAVLFNPTSETARLLLAREGGPAAAQVGVQLQMLEAVEPAGIAPAIDAAVRERADVLLVVGDPLFHTPVERVPEIVARAGVPAIYLARELVVAGGLMSYGPDLTAIAHDAAVYVDRILRGAKPADLPVAQPTRYLLTINLKTAKTLGLAVPKPLLLRADEVIQ